MDNLGSLGLNGQLIREYILENGEVRSSSPSFYGGSVNLSAENHLEECKLIVPENLVLEEISETEFAGTFNDPDEKIMLLLSGVKENLMKCSCGRYEDITLQVEKSITELLREILSMSDNLKYLV